MGGVAIASPIPGQNPGVPAATIPWIRSLAAQGEDGFLFLVDRKKAMIRTGAENVYAREVELTLLDHPDVRDCAVVGLPDPDYGEKVAAAVAPVENRSVTADELTRFVRERIAGFKTPRHVIFVQELPKTPSGKIQKHLVRPLFG